MARAKKRYVVKFENINGKGDFGTFTRMDKAERQMKSIERMNKRDIAEGYADLHTRCWIEEITVY